eukprot:TRINITY_DN37438_c0_g1_i1.p1 TRINITY_DN37438_c0_g1~~TRINITY_DN37438_c0_g1_i1.p1  ORF type:complete len:468 (+),score=120.45 TRINITY_DN37438_c0_g1_i1:109-1404(+)
MAAPKARTRKASGATDKAAAGDQAVVDGARGKAAGGHLSGSNATALATALSEALRFEVPEATDASRGSVERKEIPALVGALRQLRQKLQGLRTATDTAIDRFLPDAGGDERQADGPAAFVEMKVQVLLSYLSTLVYYMLLKANGEPVREHPALQRLQWMRAFLEKVKPIDQRLHYQMTRALEWANEKSVASSADGAAVDPRALRPGELATTVEDEEADEDDDAAGAKDDVGKDDVYRPPRIAQVEYTGDHVTEQDRAQKDLERKRARLDRSEFVRQLREEFTDAPVEVHGRLRSATAEKAERKLREQQEYEEDNMIRLRASKRDTKAQKRLLRQTHVDTGVAMSLDDAADFRELTASIDSERHGAGGKGGGRGRKARGSALEEYQDAVSRARRARGVVDSTLSGSLPGELGGGGRKRGGGSAGGGGKKRRR